MAITKTACPITRNQFTTAAKPVVVNIANQPLNASPKQFSTNSVGWFANGKVSLLVDGVPCMCQVSLNITVIGSKELPEAPTVLSPEVQAIVATSKAKAAQEQAA
jgi:hypothetical protein